MKIVNIMNFVRRIDEREENSTERMLSLTSEQLKLVNKYSLNNTFLLQYDALCDPDFVALFKNHATDKTELGLWYEIVEPLTSACSMSGYDRGLFLVDLYVPRKGKAAVKWVGNGIGTLFRATPWRMSLTSVSDLSTKP